MFIRSTQEPSYLAIPVGTAFWLATCSFGAGFCTGAFLIVFIQF